jgi:hypothetical protein
MPTDTNQQILSSATVSVSRPSLFSSLTLTVSLGGEQVATSTVDAPEITSSTIFTFSPPVTIPAGGGKSLSFSLTGVIAGHSTGSIGGSKRFRLAGVIGINQERFGDTSLALALSIFGFAILPLGVTTRRRTAVIAAIVVVLATGIVGCGNSSGGAPGQISSTQEITALDVTENGNAVGVAGLPIDLGRITRK